MGVTVGQNDPRSGCAFDKDAGYGLLVDISWDALPDSYGVNDYVIGMTDGRGVQLISPFLAHSLGKPSYRFVQCGAYVPQGSNQGARVRVIADSSRYRTGSGWGVGRFDFQSCHEAGTPACR